MNNEHYLIHKDDYVKHIDEKVMLYSFVKQLTHHIGKLKATHENEPIMKMAATYAIAAEKLFDSWGIPKSYLVFDDEDALAELMENELIAPEDAGYYPIDDDEDDACDFECRCGYCCGCCAEDEADGFDDDEDGVESVDDFIEMLGVMSAVIHNIFGDKVSVHIVIEE